MSWSLLAVIPVLSLLLLVHELGHFVVARRAGIRVEEFGFGLPPRIFGITRGDVIYSLNWIPLGAFVRMTGEDGEAEQEGSFGSKGKLARSAVLFAGPVMNFLAGALMFAAAYMIGWPTLVASPDIMVTRVTSGSPAEASGLQPGDLVVAMNGTPLDATEKFVQGTRANLGKEVTLTISRGGSQLEKTLVPRTEWPQGDGPLGVGVQPSSVKSVDVTYPPHEAIAQGFSQAVRMVGLTFAVPVMISQGALPADQARPTGPIGIFQQTSGAAEQVAENGWWFPIIFLTGLISVGLAVANLLPFPALDGGRLLLIGIEAIRGRRINPQWEGAFHFAGLMILIGLMLLISFYDITAPLPTVDWGVR